MGEVVPFIKRTGKYDARVKRTLDFIHKKVKYVRNACNNFSYESIEELDYLDGYLSDVILKTKDRPWKSDKVQKRFIRLINEYNKEFKEDKANRNNIVFYELILTYLFDIDPRLAFEERKYIKNVVEAFDNMMSEGYISSNKDVKKKLIILSSPIIKKLIQDDEEIYSKSNMIDILSLIDQGHTISDIVSTFKETDDLDKNIDLDNGIITIDKIHDYYLFQSELCVKLMERSKEPIDEKFYKYFESLGYLYSINNFSDSNKVTFIHLVNNMREKNKGIMEEIKFVSYLSDIYKRYKDSLDELGIKNINTLVYFRMINECEMEDLDILISSDNMLSKKKNL